MSMHKKLTMNACDSSNFVTPVTPENANVTDKESELADLEKIMDSFETKERVIGTIVKCDMDGLQGVSDSPPRITLGNTNTVPMLEENCSVTPNNAVQTNNGTDGMVTKDCNNNITQNIEVKGHSPCELAGVTDKNNSGTELTDVDTNSEEQ